MSLSNDSIKYTPTTGQDSKPGLESPEPKSSSMQEFYHLYREVLLITLVLTGIVFISVWIFYSRNVALNYLLGACTGVVYLRMLAKDVERLSRENSQLSKTRLALLVGVILLASQWNKLQMLPIFLGFLTYKGTLLIYVVRGAFIPDSSKLHQTLKGDGASAFREENP
ncbi:ATP synthase subunit I [Scytonema hofmannii PCC 7110]|uniref:ATP synthase subunit I n=1 Tax=Scytonema hofmannii PCC 7110 TaxID=128403 RepID=A0A139WXE3_9CYAN|nr:ATP synthase subunit I [Scytonema hofmannii]KYC37119.1 ATP synthase subunit I [Scytonema hofmannii PCC 7110]